MYKNILLESKNLWGQDVLSFGFTAVRFSTCPHYVCTRSGYECLRHSRLRANSMMTGYYVMVSLCILWKHKLFSFGL